MRNIHIAAQVLLGDNRCIFCGSITSSSRRYGLCSSCLSLVEKEKLDPDIDRLCRFCGQILLSEKDICLECRRENFFLGSRSLFLYRGVGKDLIYFYKFKKDKRLANYFARILFQDFYREGIHKYPLVPVPPSPRKIKTKGWDQIDLIVNKLVLNHSMQRADLLKKKSGKTQKNLDRAEREKAVENRYYLNSDISSQRVGKVILFDDVLTTGATLKACKKLLESAGIKDIIIRTLVRD